MGWGAAQAFYEENRSWCSSIEEAYECLYGSRGKPREGPPKNKCQLCGKRLRSARGLRDHMRDKHNLLVDHLTGETRPVTK